MWLANANLLTSAGFEDCDPLIGQWTYNGIPCRVEPAEDGTDTADPSSRDLKTTEIH